MIAYLAVRGMAGMDIGTTRQGTDPGPMENLISRARQGDQGAIEALWFRSADRLHALCLRMTADPALAEELTQESFLRAWQKLDSFREESEFTSWLHRVAVNVVLSHQRSNRRRQIREQQDPLPGLGPLGEAPDRALDLDRAIRRLPQRARAVFLLHDVEGYRHAEIAQLLKIAIGTSKTQLHRARSLLREALR
jgi:RNA polymerase sigma-70 factor (ECF subfamily)